MRFHVITYGCQMNVRDAEAVGALLRRRGHTAADGEGDADVIVVNTCSVRGKAEDKAIGKLGLLVARKRERPGLRVGAMGCMVQRLGAGLFDRVRHLDFGVGTHALARLPAILDLVAQGGGPVLDTGEEAGVLEELTGHVAGARSAFVNILLGCDRRCTYCIVPVTRGREWSRSAEDVLREVGTLAAAGVREVTLLGQSVMSYGVKNAVWPDGHVSDRGFREPLPRLLEAVAAVPGIARIRFTTGHPSGCTEELARALGEVPAVCEHLHMPCQSGSDRVLGRMGRGYTADDYRRAVERLRRAAPGLALTTDAIVGFPGETADEFEATRRFMDEIGFDNAFIFKYSPRSGTPAAEWPDDVPAAEKLRRNKQLLADQDRRSVRINAALAGRALEVLAEGPSLRNAARWSGRTRTNKIAIFPPAAGLAAGDLLTVRVERATAQTLYGAPEAAERTGNR